MARRIVQLVAGLFLYYPSRAQRSPALQHFAEVAREAMARTGLRVPRGS